MNNLRYSLRIGIRHPWLLFPNVGVVVLRNVLPNEASRIFDAAVVLKTLIQPYMPSGFALIAERREEKS
jgi:hypothetical protein